MLCRHVLELSRENERELLPDCRVGVKESESEVKMNALAAHTGIYFLNYGSYESG